MGSFRLMAECKSRDMPLKGYESSSALELYSVCPSKNIRFPGMYFIKSTL